MPITVYDANNQASTVPEEQAAQAIVSGTHGLDSKYQYNMIGTDDKVYQVPATGVREALQNGWQLGSNFDAKTQQHISSNIEANGALGAGLKSFAEHAGNAITMGALGAAKERTQSPEDKAIEEGMSAAHPVASGIGAVGGEVAGFGISTPAFGAAEAVGGLAGKAVLSSAEKAAVAGLTEEAMKKTAQTTLASSLKSAVANYATQGAILASPQAVTEAALGDPKAAGESLLWGLGTGAILGLGAGALSHVRPAVSSLLEQAGPKADEMANAQALKAVGVQKGGAKKLGEEGIERSAKVLFDEGVIKPGQSFDDLKSAISDLEDKSGGKIGEYLGKFDAVVDANPDKLKQFRFNPFEAAMKIERELSPGLETPMYSAERAELNKIVDSVAHFTEGETVAPTEPTELIKSHKAAMEEHEAAVKAHEARMNGEGGEKEYASHSEEPEKPEALTKHEQDLEQYNNDYMEAAERERNRHPGHPTAANDILPEEPARPTGPEIEEYDRKLSEYHGDQANPSPIGEEKLPSYPTAPVEHPSIEEYRVAKKKYEEDVLNRPISFKKAQEIKELFSKFPLSKLDPSPKELLQQRARGIVNGMIQDSASKVIDAATNLGLDVDPKMFSDYMKQKNIYRATQDIIKYGIENKEAANFGNRSVSLTDFISHGKGPAAIGAGAVGAMIGGVPGAVVGHQLGSVADYMLKHWAENKGLSTSAYYLKKVSKDPGSLPFIGALIAHNGVKAMNAHIEGMGSFFKTGAKRATQAAINENIRRLVPNNGQGMTKHQQFKELSEQLQTLNESPDKLVDALGPIVGTISGYAPGVASEYVNASANAIKYLSDALPKNPNPIQTPFEVNDWLPSNQQMKEFDDKVGVVIDPSSAVKDVIRGTATKAQIDALHTVYPSYAGKAKGRLLEIGMSNPKITEAGKQKLSMLLGVPVGKSMKNLSLYQASYVPAGQQPQGGPRKGAAKIKDLPSWDPSGKSKQ